MAASLLSGFDALSLFSRVLGAVARMQPVRHGGGVQRPRKTKYRKYFKNIRAVTKKDHLPLVVPTPLLRYGIYSSEKGFRMTDKQIETARVYLARNVARKEGIYKMCVFPHIPVTKKPVGVRMGGGKGSISHFVAYVKKGTMICEFDTENDFPWKICKGLDLLMPVKVAWVDRKEHLGLPVLPRPKRRRYISHDDEEAEEDKAASTKSGKTTKTGKAGKAKK